VKLAIPLFRVLVPSTVVPCLKLTTPPSVGVPNMEVTVALKITDCPRFAGDPEVVRMVVVTAGNRFTLWIRIGDMLALKLASPE
jgi:hypothetical protein